MTADPKALTKRRTKRIAALVAMVLALACHALPPDYHKPCQAIVSLCTGGGL